MKRLFVLALVCLAVVSCKKEDDDNNNGNNGNSSNCTSVNGYTAIPDTAFEQALINLGHDDVMDGRVLTANISGVDSLNVSFQKISDLTRNECFTALTELYCVENQLTSLDVSQNTALTGLGCEYNQLTSLDVGQNTALIELFCSDNEITSLDVSQNTALTNLYCRNNQLTCLNLQNGNNTNLENSKNKII